jgi:hypothetical protein
MVAVGYPTHLETLLRYDPQLDLRDRAVRTSYSSTPSRRVVGLVARLGRKTLQGLNVRNSAYRQFSPSSASLIGVRVTE